MRIESFGYTATIRLVDKLRRVDKFRLVVTSSERAELQADIAWPQLRFFYSFYLPIRQSKVSLKADKEDWGVIFRRLN